MNFFSRSNRPVAVFAPSSSDGLEPVYEEKINLDGSISLVRTGSTDFNALIQASKDSCDVYKILDRFQRGDLSVLEKVKGFFADVTDMPSSLMEAHQLVNKVAKSFDSLPAKVKDAFNNDVNGMLASIEKGDFGKILSTLTKDEVVVENHMPDVDTKVDKSEVKE